MLYFSLRLMSWLKTPLLAVESTKQTGIAWMLPKLCIADSKFVVNVLTKIFAICPDVTAGSSPNLIISLRIVNQQVVDILAGSNSGESKIDQQREEKRNCEIQVSKKEFTGYQP